MNITTTAGHVLTAFTGTLDKEYIMRGEVYTAFDKFFEELKFQGKEDLLKEISEELAELETRLIEEYEMSLDAIENDAWDSGHESGYDMGYEEGQYDGRETAFQEGYNRGYEEGKYQ